jgi:hypothetical protein
VPEVAIAEDGDASTADHDVGPAWKVVSVKAIADAGGPERATKEQLRRGVLALVRRTDPARGRVSSLQARESRSDRRMVFAAHGDEDLGR